MALLAAVGASVTGCIPPFLIKANILASVGAGLLHTLRPDSPSSQWIGYQILFGAGSGSGMQQTIVGVQVAVRQADVAFATAAIMLVSTIGGAIFICVAQNIFLDQVTRMVVRLPGMVSTSTQR